MLTANYCWMKVASELIFVGDSKSVESAGASKRHGYSNRESKCSSEDDFSFTPGVRIQGCNLSSQTTNIPPSNRPIKSNAIEKLAIV